MKLTTEQRQEIEFREQDIVAFHEGLFGFPNLKRFVLVREAEIEPFIWLLGVDEPYCALPVMDPRPTFPDFRPRPDPASIERLGLDSIEQALILVVVLVPKDGTAITANLLAPIVVNPELMIGTQMILSDSRHRAKEPLPLAASAG